MNQALCADHRCPARTSCARYRTKSWLAAATKEEQALVYKLFRHPRTMICLYHKEIGA